jgi:hypothetical protein
VRVTQFFQDAPKHSLGLLEYFGVPEPDDVVPLPRQPATSIRVRLLTLQMLDAVDFDNESPLFTKEVGHIGSNWNLPAKFETFELSVSEVVPEQTFGLGGIRTKAVRTRRREEGAEAGEAGGAHEKQNVARHLSVHHGKS